MINDNGVFWNNGFHHAHSKLVNVQRHSLSDETVQQQSASQHADHDLETAVICIIIIVQSGKKKRYTMKCMPPRMAINNHKKMSKNHPEDKSKLLFRYFPQLFVECQYQLAG